LSLLSLQVITLRLSSSFLGFRAPVTAILLAFVVLLLGAATFTAMGLTVGGSLSAEIVLALANLIWFVLLGIVGWPLYSPGLTDVGWLNIIPSVALASGLAEALAGSIPILPVISLAAWAVVASFAASKWFRFEG